MTLQTHFATLHLRFFQSCPRKESGGAWNEPTAPPWKAETLGEVSSGLRRRYTPCGAALQETSLILSVLRNVCRLAPAERAYALGHSPVPVGNDPNWSDQKRTKLIPERALGLFWYKSSGDYPWGSGWPSIWAVRGYRAGGLGAALCTGVVAGGGSVSN